MKVIYKKGLVEEVGNYRPICILPALYKLFSTIIYNRLYSLQRTDCWNKHVASVVSKCGSRQWIS